MVTAAQNIPGQKTKSKRAAKARTARGNSSAKNSSASNAAKITALQTKLREAQKALVKSRNAEASHVTVGSLLGLDSEDAAQLPSAVTRGLPVSALEKLAEGFEVTVRDLTEGLIGISRQTLDRRRKAGVLTPPESDAAVRYARLLEQATAMMEEDEEAALRWLKTPLSILQGESPIEHARTEAGAREVELLIGRIEHGVYS